MNVTEKAFASFLETFVPLVAAAERRLQMAYWNMLAGNNAGTDSDFTKALTAYKLLFADAERYAELMHFAGTRAIRDPLLARQLDGLIRGCKANMLPRDLIDEMSASDEALEQTFGNFRPTLYGKPATDNDLNDILASANDVSERIFAWQASKEVGLVMQAPLRHAVALRNRAARYLGYDNFFDMSYRLDELDPAEVLGVFAELEKKSQRAWQVLRQDITQSLLARFRVEPEQLGPWAWADPFAQSDPIGGAKAVDALLKDADVVEATAAFYDGIGLPMRQTLARSDLFERQGKNPHAFCFDMDREGDSRILANVRPTHHWISTMFQETGHVLHNLGIDRSLPWLLREDAHILTTEAAAMLGESFSYEPDVLKKLFSLPESADESLRTLKEGYRRQRLVFSRWAMVVANFEKTMYEDPNQDLQDAYWTLVERYQQIRRPKGREAMADYAAKLHINTAPCYYQGYLLADMFVAQLQEKIRTLTQGISVVGNADVGRFLVKNFLMHGARYPWKKLIRMATGKALSPVAWAKAVTK